MHELCIFFVVYYEKKSYKTCFSRISMGNDIFPLKRKKNKEFSLRGKTFLLPPLPPSPLPSYLLSCCRCMCTFPPLFYKFFFFFFYLAIHFMLALDKKKLFFNLCFYAFLS